MDTQGGSTIFCMNLPVLHFRLSSFLQEKYRILVSTPDIPAATILRRIRSVRNPAKPDALQKIILEMK
jgi:hypothetical protein